MTATHGLKLERSFNKTAEQVFKALTDAKAIGRWFGPSDAFKVTVHRWDCKVGGKYRVEFNAPDGATHICIGTFKQIVPNQKIAYSWDWEGKPTMDSVVTFTLKPEGQKTHLTLTHDGIPAADAAEHHKQGWTGSMERLGRLLA